MSVNEEVLQYCLERMEKGSHGKYREDIIVQPMFQLKDDLEITRNLADNYDINSQGTWCEWVRCIEDANKWVKNGYCY